MVHALAEVVTSIDAVGDIIHEEVKSIVWRNVLGMQLRKLLHRWPEGLDRALILIPTRRHQAVQGRRCTVSSLVNAHNAMVKEYTLLFACIWGLRDV